VPTTWPPWRMKKVTRLPSASRDRMLSSSQAASAGMARGMCSHARSSRGELNSSAATAEA
jgi:hypothetical protein